MNGAPRVHGDTGKNITGELIVRGDIGGQENTEPAVLGLKQVEDMVNL